MKYFKGEFNTHNTQRIVGEMINITYNITYFDDNGNLLPTPKPKHNMYVIDGVEYEICPTIGNIYVPDLPADQLSSVLQALKLKFEVMHYALYEKYGRHEVKIPTASAGSKQYLLISELPNLRKQAIINITDSPSRFDKFVSDFEWRVVFSAPPVTGIKHESYDLFISVSSIILDINDVVNLPDKYRSVNFPAITDMNMHIENKVELDPIIFNANCGLTFEIAKYYHTQTKEGHVGTIHRPLKFVKWEWFKPYKNMSDVWPDPYTQIKNGVLEYDTEDSELDDMENPVCFMTGVPISEDCYVFDIYEQEITEFVDEDKISNYPCAIIVDKSEEKKSGKKKSVITDSLVNVKDVAKNRPTKVTKKSTTKDATKSTTKKNTTKDTTKSTTKKSTSKDATSDNPTDEVNLIAPIKRGNSQSTGEVKQVKITYTKKYDKPKCILISPYYIHFSRQADAVSTFEKETKTKVLLYRTFCPITQAQVISRLPVTPLRKRILLAMNKHVYIDKKGYIQLGDIRLVSDTAASGDRILYGFSVDGVLQNPDHKFGVYTTHIDKLKY
jgi:hypothetical protein